LGGLTAEDRARVPEFRRTLAVVDLDAARAIEEVIPDLLHELLGGAAATGRPVACSRGWDFDYLHPSGQAALTTRIVDFAQRISAPDDSPGDFALYDPLSPHPSQRNRVCDDTLLKSDACRKTQVGRAYQRSGLDRVSQIRALVCDGGMLLTWIGAFRDEPFGEREREILQSLIDSLQRRLKAERVLRGVDSGWSALGGVLDAVGLPAFVATAAGHIEHANRAGRASFVRSREEVVHEIGRAVLGHPSRAASVHEISESGTRTRFVVFLRGRDYAARIEGARAEWGLTHRECEVLGHLVEGDANKDIATKLSRSPRTIEIHVSAILRKAGVDDRTRLALRFSGCVD
jgi:DNA-binding CsgD family transcriptional regulator